MRTKHNKIVLILMLGMLSALAPITNDMYLPAFPVITADLQTSASLLQLSLTASLLGIAFGQLIFGAWSDFRGRKGPLLVALVTYTISSLLCAIAPNIWFLIILRFIQGFAGAGGIVIARACVRDLYSGSEMTKIYSGLMLILGLTPIVTPIIGSLLLHLMSWNGIFIVLAIIGVALFLFVYTSLQETLSVEERLKGGLTHTLMTMKSLFRDRIYIGYVFTQGFSLAALYAYIAASPFVYQVIYGLSAQVYSVLLGLNAIGYTIMTQIIGRLAGKISESKLLLIGLCSALMGGVSLLIVIVTEAGLLSLVIALLLCMSSIGMISTTCFPLAMQNQAVNAGSAGALIGVMQFTIGGIVAPLVGLGGSQTAVPMGVLIVLSQLAALFVYLFIVRRAEQSTHQLANQEFHM